MSAIANCPWCGHHTEIDLMGAYVRVVCTNGACLAMGPDAPTEAGAIAAWNRVAAVGDVVAALGALMAPWEGVPNGDLLNVMWGGGIPPIDLLIAARAALAAARGETP